MTRSLLLVFAIALSVSLTLGCGMAAEPVVVPTQPASMAVVVGDATLTFAAPEIVAWSTEAVAPRNFASWYEPWEPWPTKGKDKKLNTIELGPRRDETGTQILGGLFRSIQPESVVVTSADGTKTFVAGQDYKLEATWGQIANIDSRLGAEWEAKLLVKCNYALQRLDLVQKKPDGSYAVKQGKSAIVCPALPEPDAGCQAVAGVYIAPWPQDGAYVISAENILTIHPAEPVAPINPKAVARTLAKLKEGKPVSIALMGASITAGAEATRWWDEARVFTDKDTAWRGRFIYTLRQRFPQATVTPIPAYRGGTQTEYGLEQFEKVVAPARPDLALVAFGGNDVNGPIGKGPNNPPEQYKEQLTRLVSGIKASGCEVMIVITMPRNPWVRNGVPQRWPQYRQIMLDVGREQDVAVADVYDEWANLTTRGIPPYTQLHNWNNHPGDFGHKLFADVILRFFEK